jgi:hypothetical protein
MNLLKSSPFFLFALLVFLAFSCQKEESGEPALTKVPPPQAKISVNENGFLVFSDYETFDKTIAELQEKSRFEIIEWEAQYDFTSMRSFYEKGMEEQQKLVEDLEDSNSEADIDYADFVLNHPEVFKIRDNGFITENTFRNDVTPLISNDGIVKIGGAIYQFSYNYLKVIGDGDDAKIKLLNNFQETDSAANILVNKVSRGIGNDENSRRSFYSTADSGKIPEHGSTSCHKFRMRAELTLATVNVPVYETYWGESIDYTNGTREWKWITYIASYNTKNYFQAYCYVDRTRNFCLAGWTEDYRSKRIIRAKYQREGVHYNKFHETPNETNQLRWTIFETTTSGYNNPGDDVIQAEVSFEDVNRHYATNSRDLTIRFN